MISTGENDVQVYKETQVEEYEERVSKNHQGCKFKSKGGPERSYDVDTDLPGGENLSDELWKGSKK